jgi:methylmalonyl-CoA/ethylmalonyl-CoA epimerase
MLALNLHHTAIAVHDLDSTLNALDAMFRVGPISREVVEEQGVEEAMVPFGGSYLQVLQALDEDTPVGRFLSKRGEGIHHLAVQVADIDAALSHLRDVGVRIVGDGPSIGGGGNRIAFIDPSGLNGTLVELIEVA